MPTTFAGLVKELQALEPLQMEKEKQQREKDIRISCGPVLTEKWLWQLFIKTGAEIGDEEIIQLLQELWDTKPSLEDKARGLAEFQAALVDAPVKKILPLMPFLEGILKTQANLNAFLNDPQDYINKHKELSAHDAQVLVIIANDPSLRSLPSLRGVLNVSKKVETPLSHQMHTLYETGLKDYGSLDAATFPQCINPEHEDEVLANSTKPYYGPPVMGMGAQAQYTPSLITKAANAVNVRKAGVCHTFAQLAADQLFKAMKAHELGDVSVKIVSHQAGLGSHTFLLVGHESDNLEDLSHCVIVDAWAVAMGYKETEGVYVKENYPYSPMLKNLKCVYDSKAPQATESKAHGGKSRIA